jgi:hypothetical protein
LNSFFDSGPLPEWKDLRKWLGKDMPWDLVSKWNEEGEGDWLNQYVKEMMTKSKPAATVQSQQLLRIETVKDAKNVDVNIRLATGTDIQQLQLFATSERLKVTGLPNGKKRIIRFPCLVYPRSGKVELKMDQLLVRFRRRPPSKTEYELFI